MRDYFQATNPIRFRFPIDGDCLNRNDGEEIGDQLKILATVEAPEGHDVEICGTKAEVCGNLYRASVLLEGRECTLRAEDKTAGTASEIKVFRLQNPLGGYRLSSDDNIIFLADINEHKDEYSSIFDNPYLSVYKKAQDRYGAKVHLNLFYEFEDVSRSYFSTERQYFNLSMMTDKFKEEFRANSDWLKFSFHGKGEFPMEPYKYADGETVRTDAEKVIAEVIRFAGEEILSGCTTVHFGEANEEGVRALRQMGYRAMTGYFMTEGAPVAYYAPKELIQHIYNRDFWKDTKTDVLFGRIDAVLNYKDRAAHVQTVRDAVESPTRGGFLSVMIHEQYFYPDYKYYLADFEDRVLEACRILTEYGYEGRHICEVDGIPPLK